MVNSSFSDLGWIADFIKSTAQSVPEVIGITPSTDTLQWRQDNPVSSIASQFAGMAVPYGGWFYASTKIPKLAKAIDNIGDIVNKPISTGFKREVVRFAPFEALRLPASQAFGDRPFQSELMGSMLDLALGGGIGGLIHGVAAAGLRSPTLPTIFPGIDINAPPSLQARHMKGLIDQGAVSPELMPTARRELDLQMKEARVQELGKTQKYVAALQPKGASAQTVKDLDRQLNYWFRPTHKPDEKALQVRAFSRAEDKNFKTGELWQAESDLAGISGPVVDGHHVDLPWQHGQYFRSLSFNLASGAKKAAEVNNTFTKNFENIGNGWFMAREADDGMFIMAKKYNGEVSKADPADKWLLFKTDQPGKFAPENQAWADAMVASHHWIPEAAVDLDYGLAGNIIKGFKREIPFRNYQMISKPGVIERVIDKLGPVGDSEVVVGIREAFREYLTPRSKQFTKVPRANYISQASKMSSDHALGVVNELMNGKVSLQAGKSVFFGHLNQVRGELGLPPLRQVGRSLGQDEFAEVFENVIRKGVSLDKAELLYKNGKLSENGIDFLRALQAVDDVTTLNVSKAEKAVGKRQTEWMQGHYGWSHTWEGDIRIPLLNEKGQLVFLAGGPNKKAAKKMADQALLEHPNWKKGDEYSKTQLLKKLEKVGSPLEDVNELSTLAPSFTLERAGVGGYKWSNRTPTVNEFLDDIERGLTARWRYQHNISANDQLAPDLAKLARENLAAYNQVIFRMNHDSGIKGDWDRAMNRAADRFLAGIIGSNSASKIVGVTNTTLYNLQLGAMNLAFPAVNLLTFVQTTLPEVAFVLHGLPASKMPYYSAFLGGGVTGPTGAMAVLQPLKIAWNALREMRRPSQELADDIAWAMNNRTLDPRHVENYIGESSQKFGDIYRLAKGDIRGKDFDFLEWLRATSEWLPANSERLARTHSYVMGVIMARDLLRKNGQMLTKLQQRQFAQQFTNNTMYLYSSADKPKVLTSPVGSGLGLFKNWMFNYMGQMGQYGQEAFLKNNWAPLLWQTAGTFAMGGLASTPIIWAADAFARAFTGNDAMTAAYDEFGEDADGIMYGLPAWLSGVSFYSQVQAPGSNPARDAVMLFDSVIWDRMKATGAAFGGAMDHWRATGKHPGSDPHTRLQMARAFAPATIYRMMASTTDGSVLSASTGYPLVKDLSFYEQMLYKLKVNPVKIDRAMAVSDRLYSQREERRKSVQVLGEAFANAQMQGDGAEMALIMRQAMVWGVDASSVMKSALIRLDKHQDDAIGRGYKPADRYKYRNVLGE